MLDIPHAAAIDVQEVHVAVDIMRAGDACVAILCSQCGSLIMADGMQDSSMQAEA